MNRIRTVLAALLVAAVVTALAGCGGTARTPEPPATPEVTEADLHFFVGEESAPVTVTVFEDFLCPWCRDLDRVGHDRLVALTEGGLVRLDLRPYDHLPRYGTYSRDSARVWAAVTATSEPEVALAFHEALYADQPAEDATPPTQADLVDVAVAAGADREEVTARLDDGYAEAWVDLATEVADATVEYTPTALVDGREVPWPDGLTTRQYVARVVAAARAAEATCDRRCVG